MSSISSRASDVGGQKSALRKQVAAVCYRTGGLGIEFLLVRTRGGRWIFPKGGVEPGLTQAQSAALEAFEEAGVHGRIEEMPFARYRIDKAARRKPAGQKSPAKASSGRRKKARAAVALRGECETVTAHLCEVSHLEAPQEAYRTPTWFSAEKAKKRLLAKRDEEFGGEIATVVDRAVSRIRRLGTNGGREFQNDGLRKVRFEAGEDAAATGFERFGGRGTSFAPGTGSTSLARRLLSEAQGLRQRSRLELVADGPWSPRRKSGYIQ